MEAQTLSAFAARSLGEQAYLLNVTHAEMDAHHEIGRCNHYEDDHQASQYDLNMLH